MTADMGIIEHDGIALLKSKTSLKQLLIPKRQQSQQALRKRSQSSSRVSKDDSLQTAVPYNCIKTAVVGVKSIEPRSATSARAPSSVHSVTLSSRPSTSRGVPKQQGNDFILATERQAEIPKHTEQRSGRHRASTLTNFSKPYGLLQEHTLIPTPRPVRKISHQLLGHDSSNPSPRYIQRAITDSALSGTTTQNINEVRTASMPAQDQSSQLGAQIPQSSGAKRLDETVSQSPERMSESSTLGRDGTRGSTQSVHSFGSSLRESKHSSTFTKKSSTTEITLDADVLVENKEVIKIDSETNSYDDSDDLASPISPDILEHNRTSIQITEAMTAPIWSLLTPGRNINSQSRPLISYERVRNMLHQPPALQKPTASHDHYGFRKSSRDVTLDSYNTWYQDYSKFQTKRNKKWQDMLADHRNSPSNPNGFPAPSAKVQRYIRKGLPPACRGDAWFFYSGGAKLLKDHPNHYVDLVIQSQTDHLNRNDREAVERDLHRTFPDNIHFKTETTSTSTHIIETPIMTALRRILCAFAVDHPKIGYCQSLNFIAGLLLLFLPEEKAYWMLHIITTDLLPGTHELSLEGANIDLWVLMLALKQANPGVWAKVGGDVGSSSSRLPPISLCTTSWFMSIFIGTLPIESVLRVWDVLFYEGSKTLFRIALAIFKVGETQIKSVQDPMETFQIVQTLPRKMVDIGNLFDIAFSRGEVGKLWIEKRRGERKAFYAKARAVEKARRESKDLEIQKSPTSHGEEPTSPAATDMASPTSTLGVESRDGYWGRIKDIKSER